MHRVPLRECCGPNAREDSQLAILQRIAGQAGAPEHSSFSFPLDVAHLQLADELTRFRPDPGIPAQDVVEAQSRVAATYCCLDPRGIAPLLPPASARLKSR
jgi:hypothetical protein